MKNIAVCFFSIIFSFLTQASLFAQPEAKFRIPVKPVTEKNKGEMLYCNLETNRVEYNEAAAWRSAELANCRCDVFISTYDESECLGVEKYPAEPERAVTMVGLNNPVQHCIVWVWNGDGTLRPLNDLQKCLTFLGWANRKRAFSVANYTGADHQVWTFDEKTQAIVNSRTSPVRDQTNTVDHYAQLIAWSYNGSYKQTWKRASTWIAVAQAHPSPQRYPVKLLVNADGSLLEPASVAADRAKMGLNQLMAAYGQTPFQRDFSSFPGTVSSDKALTEKRLRLDMQYNQQGRQVLDNWKSTGMYAPPSQDFEIRIHNTEPVYFKVRFNPHTDKLQTTSANILKEKEYRRSPSVSSVVSLSGSNETFRLRNDLGGLIIIEADGPPNQVLDISIRALEAPYYNGTQSQKEWERICTQPTPWGEVEGKYFVLSEKSETLKKMSVAQLDAVIHYYDSLVICHDILSGYPDRLSSAKHRFTRDIQITAGYAHSGFPMMTQWDLVNPVIDQIDIWGNGHELGHNYQRQAFRSRFGVEVTVNLFTVHSFERMFPHHLDRLDNVYETVCNKFLNGSLDYDREQDVFQRLIFLLQIRLYAGWEPFQKLYTIYRNLSPKEEEEKCGTDQTKIDFFYTQICALSSVDFTQHFDAWKLPLSAKARAEVARLRLTPPNKVVSLLRHRPVIILKNSETNLYLAQQNQPTAVGIAQENGNQNRWVVIKNTDNTISLQNMATRQFLYATGNRFEGNPGSEGGWLSSPEVTCVAPTVDDRARWHLIGGGPQYQLKNKATSRLLFSTGEVNGGSSSGTEEQSPKIVGADANYYNRSVWQIKGLEGGL